MFVAGDLVAARDAEGRWFRKLIIGPSGRDFPRCWNVKWEWQTDDEWTPWPLKDIVPIADRPDALSISDYRALQDQA